MKAIKQEYAVIDLDYCEFVTDWHGTVKAAMEDFRGCLDCINANNTFRIVAMNASQDIEFCKVDPVPKDDFVILVDGKAWKG